MIVRGDLALHHAFCIIGPFLWLIVHATMVVLVLVPVLVLTGSGLLDVGSDVLVVVWEDIMAGAIG